MILVLIARCSTMVYVEGDATMNRYQDAEGKDRSSLSIVEREFPITK